MSRPVALVLAALTAFFAVLPLSLDKPGWPAGMKADEAAYYLMAMSIAHDGDLRLTVEDTERAFREFPYGPIDNLILATDDGWNTVVFGKPYLYSLAAAPFARLAGANGLLCFNALLAWSLAWLGTLYLSRFNPPGTAALFACGSTVASAGFAYAYWLQPEIFAMAAVGASCFFVFQPLAATWRRLVPAAAVSGAVLALAAYHKPVFALVGLPLVLALARRRLRRAAVAWIAGFALSFAAAAAGSLAWIGHPTAYLGLDRMGVTLCEPGVLPVAPLPPGQWGPTPERPTAGAWTWIFAIPKVPAGAFFESLAAFLWGRHTGFLLYFPFAALAAALFLVHGRRDPDRWALLASLAGVALFFLLFIPHNWQGGGGFVGNRYFVNVVPAFLYLATRVGPAATLAGWVAAGALVGPILLSPFGRAVPEPTLQAHVRGGPLAWFPLELGLRELPGYLDQSLGGATFRGRRDVFLPRGEGFWVRQATDAEIWVSGLAPLERAVFLVTSPAANRVALALGEDRQILEFAAGGGTKRVTLAPGGADRVRRPGGTPVYFHRLTVESETGRVRQWTREFPPEPCTYFAANARWEESFPVGAELLFLGDGAALEGDVYGVAWGEVALPRAMVAGEEVTVRVPLANASAVAWEAAGAARVRLGARWVGPGGEVLDPGTRAELPLPVAPGQEVAVELELAAPAVPGTYRLEIEPVFEHVAWFSEKGAAPRVGEVEVVAGGGEEEGEELGRAERQGEERGAA